MLQRVSSHGHEPSQTTLPGNTNLLWYTPACTSLNKCILSQHGVLHEFLGMHSLRSLWGSLIRLIKNFFFPCSDQILTPLLIPEEFLLWSQVPAQGGAGATQEQIWTWLLLFISPEWQLSHLHTMNSASVFWAVLSAGNCSRSWWGGCSLIGRRD